MEAVDELKAERDQQRDEQQDVRQISRDLGAGRVNIDVDAVGDEQKPGSEDPEKQDHGQWVKTFIEIWSGGRLDRRSVGHSGIQCYVTHLTPLYEVRGMFDGLS